MVAPSPARWSICLTKAKHRPPALSTGVKALNCPLGFPKSGAFALSIRVVMAFQGYAAGATLECHQDRGGAATYCVGCV